MKPRLVTISTGDELVRGRSADTNAPWIAARAAEAGVLRVRHLTIGDEPLELARAFADAAAAAPFVVTTGGLGPTVDDHTRAAAAAAAGVPLVFREELWREIRDRYAARGRTLPDSNRVQAEIPRGATVIENPLGTAPGFRLVLHGAVLHFLSGVPREMEAMFTASVLPELRSAGGGSAHESIATYGLPEAAVNDRLEDLLRAEDPSVGLAADYGVIRVSMTSVGPGAAERIATAAAAVRARLPDEVLEGATPAEAVHRLLLDRKATLATAESCTGGGIGYALTEVAGISAVYRGGIVAYANEAKTALLGVPPETIAAHGAVSEAVARAMAEGARRATGADFGVAVTGVAGPGGGTAEKPVGLVHFAVAGPSGTIVDRRIWPGDRTFVRRFSVNHALALTRRALRNP